MKFTTKLDFVWSFLIDNSIPEFDNISGGIFLPDYGRLKSHNSQLGIIMTVICTFGGYICFITF